MTLQISMLEEAVQRLHVRLQRHIRALYVLHANGNDEAALIALDRITQLNTKIAELNALLDSFEATEAREVSDPGIIFGSGEEEPVALIVPQEVIIDDPDQDDVEMEYRGAVVATVLMLLVVAIGILGWSYARQFLGVAEGIKQTAQMAAVEAELPAVTVPAPPTDVTVADIDTVTYVVQKGDTLWSIATTQLGDPQQWATIYGQNASVVGDDPNLIFPGQVLTITKVSVGSTTIG